MITNFNLYPYNTPVIMSEDAFQAYGGDLANISVEQRDSAFVIAEQAVSEDIGTFLIPTNVTGSYSLTPNTVLNQFLLDHSYVNQVYWARFHDFKEDVYYSVSGTSNVYVGLRDARLGILDINYFLGNCNCYTRGTLYPYQVDVAYNTGLPTGISLSPNILLALTTYSQIILNEIIGYGNEAPGDIGVKNYQNQSYRESRVALLRTTFGTSAKAQFVHKLLTPYRVLRQVGW